MAITKERTEEIVIGDLQEAQHLFERDSSYLKIIGEHYGADISGRGNMIRIKGEEEAVENSLHVIARIRHMIASRIRLSERQVRLVMSLIDQGKGNLLQEMEDDIINFTKNGAPIRPRTLGQKLYVDTIRRNSITFGIGPAGTGKTYLAVALAAFALRNHDVQRIILVRPAVEAGEKLGFLPGDMQEKVNPYLRPLFDGLMDMFGPEEFTRLQQKGQIDLPPNVRSGLIDAERVLKDVKDIGHVHFSEDDVVRHDLVAAIIHAYEEDARHRNKNGSRKGERKENKEG